VGDLVASEAIGAVDGPADLGKTFAIDHALESVGEPVVRLTFEARRRRGWSPTGCCAR
jgi:hypothetical protein